MAKKTRTPTVQTEEVQPSSDMGKIIGYANGLPIEERAGTAHDPSTGRFSSAGAGGASARNKLMAEYAKKQTDPGAALKKAVHHLAESGSKVGKPDFSGKSTVHVDGDHVGHIRPGADLVGKPASKSGYSAHHKDGVITPHHFKEDAIKALAESHFHHLLTNNTAQKKPQFKQSVALSHLLKKHK